MTFEEAVIILSEQIEDFLPEEKWEVYENALDAVLGHIDDLELTLMDMSNFIDRRDQELRDLLDETWDDVD